MCRIVGFWDFNYKGAYNLQKTIVSMRDRLVHGGPDDAGLFINYKNALVLGHRRLSILDLSQSGRQPMEYDGLVIVYNGEVYNYTEIRKELENEGYSFNSNTDTEVVLKAFHKWSLEAIYKFRGMFAFAVWDKEKQQLILCRDRIGVKPLYWYYKDGLFMFSSELKAFHEHPKFRKELNLEALFLYLQYGYITYPYTVFNNAYKLEPGHFLIIDRNKNIKKKKYWDVAYFFIKGYQERNKWLKKNENELVEELEGLLIESFKLRLIADVPIGVFLSGGVDSTMVTTILSKEGIKLKTFTIGFYEKGYNEAKYAKKIADFLETEHYELYCTSKEALEIIPKLPDLFDEPFADSSAIPTYLVSELARSYVKVSLSADGGDEQFCGYDRYLIFSRPLFRILNQPVIYFLLTPIIKLLKPDFAYKIYEIFRPFLPKYNNFKDKYMKLKNIIEYKNKAKDKIFLYDISTKYFLESEIKNLGIYSNLNHLFKIEPYFKLDVLSQCMLLDIKTYLTDDVLVKVDRATMGMALEGREPFLDHKIVEWSSQLPVEFKFRGGLTKYLLRKLLYKYIPKKLIDRPKRGFGAPIHIWFKKELRNLYEEYLNPQRIKSESIFDENYVTKLLQDFLDNRGVNHNKLWLLFIFELWREKCL